MRGLGNREGVFWIYSAHIKERDWALMVFAVEPGLDPLRDDPRFQEILRKLGLQNP
jgi:hypothetical protein